jgi:tRNA pseudouridine(38-40) synthase
MTFWKVVLSYDGGPFHGWQVQPVRPTVQGALAAAIEKITGERGRDGRMPGCMLWDRWRVLRWSRRFQRRISGGR